MWANYNENNPNQKDTYDTYLSLFKSENISFSRPSVDDCEICLNYNDHMITFQCESYIQDAFSMMWNLVMQHQVKYRASREEYQNPLASESTCYAVDMQNVVLCRS